MIVEVGLGDEEPRRYEVRRRGGRFELRRLDGPSEATGPESDDSDGHAGAYGEAAGDDAARVTTPTSPDDGGATVVVDWRRPEDGIYSLLVDRSSWEVFVEDAADHLVVHLRNHTFRVRAVDARRRRAAALAAASDGMARITAPIPGRVAAILQPQGSPVKKGQGIIVLEAMKMENELRAPRDGTLVSIAVEEGQGVEGGTLLATIE